MTTRLRKAADLVTMGHLRSHGLRDLLVYCESGWCHHHAKLNVERLPDDAPHALSEHALQ
jgi:hypothetical protein